MQSPLQKRSFAHSDRHEGSVQRSGEETLGIMGKDLTTAAQSHLTVTATAAICGIVERVEIERDKRKKGEVRKRGRKNDLDSTQQRNL